MILRTLTLKNYKQYQLLELDFKEGLTGIVGRNGAGKSTIFEGVLVCLFGDIRGEKSLIRSSWVEQKKAVSLALEFEVQNKLYRVVREYRGKSLTHHAHLYNHKEESLATGATPVTREVEKLIGMDKEAFTRSIFSGQKELGEISNTKGEERRKMVRKMVGLDKLDKIQNIVREDRNSTKNRIKGKSELLLETEELESLEKDLKSKNKEQSNTQKELDKLDKAVQKKQESYKKAQADFEAQNKLYKAHNDIITELTRYETGIENLQSRDEEHDLRIKQLKDLQKELKKQEPKIVAFEKQKEAFAKLESQKEQHEKAKRLQEQQHLIDKQIKEYEANLKAMEAIPDRIQKGKLHIAELDKSLKENQLALKNSNDTLQKAQSEISVIQSKVKEREQQIAQINSLGKDAECPTCFQPLIDSYDTTLQRFQKDIDELITKQLQQLTTTAEAEKKQRDQLQSAVEEQQESRQKAASFLATLEAQEKQKQQLEDQLVKTLNNFKSYEEQIKELGKIDFDLSLYNNTKTEIENFRNTYIEYRSKLDEAAKLPEEEEAKKQLLERIKKGKASISEKTKELKALKFSESKYQETHKAQSTAETERDEALSAHNQQKEILNDINNQIQNVQNTLKHHNDTLASIQKQQTDLDELEALDVTFSKFKSSALNKVRPIIGQHASHLFTQITKGRYESIAVNENFEFHIFDNGKEYPITRFSGGEVDLANLCLRIGISKAISELSGSSAAMSLLCFDEIFGSQDEGRRFEILSALDLLKEQYRQIYIVSHIESIKDYFPNILQVQKDRDGSGVEWL
ncbi:MAG: hypothetical protein AB8F74_13480 [Saprospiraceae bacterium]